MIDPVSDSGLLSKEYSLLLVGARVLVAEDCPVTLAMLGAALSDWGVEVVTATDGEQALAILSSDDPPKIGSARLVDAWPQRPRGLSAHKKPACQTLRLYAAAHIHVG